MSGPTDNAEKWFDRCLLGAGALGGHDCLMRVLLGRANGHPWMADAPIWRVVNVFVEARVLLLPFSTAPFVPGAIAAEGLSLDGASVDSGNAVTSRRASKIIVEKGNS